MGNDWKVVASVGHVRDLPERELGVSIPDFVPNYVPTKRGKDVLKKLQALAKSATAVYLATDPDREGEAIAWHIADALRLPSPKRITYGEITASAIKAAIDAPRTLDMSLVRAQEARRILDRLCGYMVSGPLSNAANSRLSAGRVQSPAVRLVVEREKAIQDFVSTTHYGAKLLFAEGFHAQWLTDGWHEGDYLLDKDLAERAASIRALTVEDYKETERRVAPPAPFTTSSLQQAASNALGFTPKNTMAHAQKLYEQGHITYMRTDSPNLSAEAVEEIRQFCAAKSWPLVEKVRTWKSKQGAQEAHEAIRPTHCEVEEAGENPQEQALYALIRLRTLASQLEDAVYDVRTLQLSGNLDEKTALFQAKGSVLQRAGWKVLMQNDAATQDAEREEDMDNAVPKLALQDNVTASDGTVLTKKTKAPTRFSEASLVRELENKGIGRPATFAAIIDTIIQRDYVRTEKKFLVPTPLGEQVVHLLSNHFSFADYTFTKTLEEHLDNIAAGTMSYKDVMLAAHSTLEQELTAFAGKYPQSKRTPSKLTSFLCPDCGKPLAQRTSVHGAFFGCSGYPKCKKTFRLTDENKPDFGAKK